MGFVKIDLSVDDYRLLSEQATGIDEVLKQLFFDTDNQKQILTELNNYHSDEDGAPIVPEFEIADITYNPATLTGQVRFAYRVNFSFACADKRATTNHFETSNFTVDKQAINLSIHDKISRDTYEEF